MSDLWCHLVSQTCPTYKWNLAQKRNLDCFFLRVDGKKKAVAIWWNVAIERWGCFKKPIHNAISVSHFLFFLTLLLMRYSWLLEIFHFEHEAFIVLLGTRGNEDWAFCWTGVWQMLFFFGNICGRYSRFGSSPNIAWKKSSVPSQLSAETWVCGNWMSNMCGQHQTQWGMIAIM